MRKIIVAAFISLDGVIQAPGAPEEDPSGDFVHGGWLVPYSDEALDKATGDLFARPFELLLGRRTYDIFAAYWPLVPADAEHGNISALFNKTVKHVATHRPETLAWQNSRALGEDVVASLRDLKRQDGPDLLTQGSSDLVQQLLATDLVDELHLRVFPLVLGKGKRLFDADGQAAAFRLDSSTVSSSGVVIARYLRDGEVRTGSFDIE